MRERCGDSLRFRHRRVASYAADEAGSACSGIAASALRGLDLLALPGLRSAGNASVEEASLGAVGFHNLDPTHPFAVVLEEIKLLIVALLQLLQRRNLA